MGRTGRREPHAVEFGARVRACRTELAWTQEQLAERAGLHFTYLSSLERGERNVSLRNILRVAQALDVDAGLLVSGIEVEPEA